MTSPALKPALNELRALIDRLRHTSRWIRHDDSIGTVHNLGSVLCGTTRPGGYPGLHAAPDVLDYIVAAQPQVIAELFDTIDDYLKAPPTDVGMVLCTMTIAGELAKEQETLMLHCLAVPRRGELLIIGERKFRVEDVSWKHAGRPASPTLRCTEVM